MVRARDGVLVDLAFDGDVGDLARAGLDPRALVAGAAPARGAVLAAPLRPGKIVAVGLNYLDHVRESGMERPARPVVFAKFPSSVIGPGDAIVVDGNLIARVDWEADLALVVGAADDASRRAFLEPRRSLRSGDVVETEVERRGLLRNPVAGLAP